MLTKTENNSTNLHNHEIHRKTDEIFAKERNNVQHSRTDKKNAALTAQSNAPGGVLALTSSISARTREMQNDIIFDRFLVGFWDTFWSLFGSFLASSWPAPGQLLASSWPASGQLLASFWPASGQLLASFWPDFGPDLDPFWGTSKKVGFQGGGYLGQSKSRPEIGKCLWKWRFWQPRFCRDPVLNTFWALFGSFLASFWPAFGQLLTSFWAAPGQLFSVFCLAFEHDLSIPFERDLDVAFWNDLGSFFHQNWAISSGSGGAPRPAVGSTHLLT